MPARARCEAASEARPADGVADVKKDFVRSDIHIYICLVRADSEKRSSWEWGCSQPRSMGSRSFRMAAAVDEVGTPW
jgi:hypothetical protein